MASVKRRAEDVSLPREDGISTASAQVEKGVAVSAHAARGSLKRAFPAERARVQSSPTFEGGTTERTPVEALGGTGSVSNTLGRLALRCSGCGYGAIARTMPPQCPMCACADWDFEDWRPFSSPNGRTSLIT
jgi:rubrerythrin